MYGFYFSLSSVRCCIVTPCISTLYAHVLFSLSFAFGCLSLPFWFQSDGRETNEEKMRKYLPMRDATLFSRVSSSWPNDFAQKILTLCTVSFKLSDSIHFLLTSIACNIHTCHRRKKNNNTLPFLWSMVSRRFLNSMLHQDYTLIL